MHVLPEITEIVALALSEDLGVTPEEIAPFVQRSAPSAACRSAGLLAGDVTSAATVPATARFTGAIVAREPLVVAGLPVAEQVWSTLARAASVEEGGPTTCPEAAAELEIFPLVAEGARVDAGVRIAEVTGPARVILAGERTALNFLMVLSGIATETARWVAEAGPELTVCDTRKTLPGLRDLSKYAVRVGGGTNHRVGLWDMVLIKDNHVAAVGGLERAMSSVLSSGNDLTVEVEADSVEAAIASARAGADIVLLDNMSDDELADAVRAVRDVATSAGRRILTEASGGIRFERLAGLAATGVDRVSTSALTLARPVDLALDAE